LIRRDPFRHAAITPPHYAFITLSHWLSWRRARCRHADTPLMLMPLRAISHIRQPPAAFTPRQMADIDTMLITPPRQLFAMPLRFFDLAADAILPHYAY